MSNSSVFKLIANDGKADRMIMATELLNQRIKDIMCMRAGQGFADPTPTLVDIERTHILFVNAHFKPFAAHGFEYFKQRPQSGGIVWGQSVQFSIPQYGDFFSDMAVHVELAATSATVGTVPLAFPARPGVADVPAASNTFRQVSETPDFPNTNTYTRYTQEYVNLNGTPVELGSAASNYVRYCEYPGERLFSNVRFDVNSNPLDDYHAESMIFRRKFEILPHKLTGWKRIVGQEVPIDGVSDALSIAGTSSWPGVPAAPGTADPDQSTAINGLTDNLGNSIAAAPSNQALSSRKVVQVLNGPQTPKAQQPALEMFVPLDFWFNKDVRLAVPSVSIPFGQRFITIQIEDQNRILFTAPGNLFLRLTVEQIVADGTATPVGVTNYNKYQTLTPVLAVGSNIDSTQQIRTFDLYINNIFMNPEIHDIYIKRIGFTLIRAHLRQRNDLNLSRTETQLQNLKWPIEYMYVGFRPTFNVSSSNPNQYRDWHKFGSINDQVIYESARSELRVNNDAAAAWNWTASAVVPAIASQIQTCRVVYPQQSDVVDALGLMAHGIKLFDNYSPLFYNAYQTHVYGGLNLNTPEDKGAFLFTFCFYPGTYNPSGHFNVSRAREFYINVDSTFISSVNTTEQLILARAINFLLISDGSAVLRYST